jgi:uncharacterized integral membrane protein
MSGSKKGGVMMKDTGLRMKPRHWAGIVLGVFCLILLIQNAQVVSFNILFWKISMSRIIAFPLLVLMGAAIGYVVGRYAKYGAGK